MADLYLFFRGRPLVRISRGGKIAGPVSKFCHALSSPFSLRFECTLHTSKLTPSYQFELSGFVSQLPYGYAEGRLGIW